MPNGSTKQQQLKLRLRRLDIRCAEAARQHQLIRHGLETSLPSRSSKRFFW
jgi:hypothetical protein